MSAPLTEKEFSKHLNTKFITTTEPPLEFELTQIKGYLGGANEETGMERFSLFFYGPGNRLPQGIYPVEHEAMGAFELFLVPVGQSEGGYQYEAVFNYYKE